MHERRRRNPAGSRTNFRAWYPARSSCQRGLQTLNTKPNCAALRALKPFPYLVLPSSRAQLEVSSLRFEFYVSSVSSTVRCRTKYTSNCNRSGASYHNGLG
ncbi:hypothetical protein PISMIDRAFT_606546 [Pisolithus microcarpus 441]|uniref:Uncharacterized protein n=1 Tax=Pisolithus microcarpus 441 TaxID=765257 RepID=A0A0C9ZFT9_9AGAM|nr:hypothetical protein PISMIDRAFT_606546 [Pisolithus microcarpus 441]